jgi:hypothetical protein
MVQVWRPPQKFQRPLFSNGGSYGIKKYGVEVSFNGMTSLLNFIKSINLFQKDADGETHGRDHIILTFSFKESRLMMK